MMVSHVQNDKMSFFVTRKPKNFVFWEDDSLQVRHVEALVLHTVHGLVVQNVVHIDT
ncbi:hypothetical protein HMPREF0083_03538 [Aneurinibacillus aneurinilyticus ATCC 12856]|uniref:Uncharacterized protein n=1 Tax=Aneurinibacillus aneurinilyticus ATCC 12856 TaxID=649747 RepID=U1X1K0_ANEAE|nr:hypothetical protein HMPREF0083_03538 [Aneurinibacillus aneurinilyticus ATCC 12856]